MKTILYATKCSKNSITSLRYAHYISTALNAKLVILHIFDVPSLAGASMIRPMHQIEKKALNEHRTLLQAYCKKHLDDKLDRLDLQLEVVQDTSITRGILHKSKELNIDMIIVGTRDQYSDHGVLVGDIAKTLITRSQCPLLVVPDKTDAKQLKHIAYATDFEEGDVIAIEKLSHIAMPFEAKIHVIHISPTHEFDGKDQMEWFKELVLQKVSYWNIEFEIVVSENIYEGLTSYLKDNNADLVALLEREDRGLFKKLFHRDLVKQLESHTVIPLLSFNSR